MAGRISSAEMLCDFVEKAGQPEGKPIFCQLSHSISCLYLYESCKDLGFSIHNFTSVTSFVVFDLLPPCVTPWPTKLAPTEVMLLSYFRLFLWLVERVHGTDTGAKGRRGKDGGKDETQESSAGLPKCGVHRLYCLWGRKGKTIKSPKV